MNGVLIIDKPAGLTSHDVVARVRRTFRERRTGHTGTLDPFATGVLVVLIGRATRLAQFLSGAEKEYLAEVRFGYATDTGDLTGTARPETVDGRAAKDFARAWDAEKIETALASLRGEIEQVPPMYSAKKVGGRKLYEMARRGEVIERAPVRVRIRELEAVRGADDLLRHNEDGTCDLTVRVVCSAGTYIRTLAESIGERLGTGAHLAALRRTRAGDFKIETAHTLAEIEAVAGENGDFEKMILSPRAALSKMDCVHLTEEDAQRTRHGAMVRPPAVGSAEWLEGQPVMLVAQGDLIAVGVYDAIEGALRPRVVIAPDE